MGCANGGTFECCETSGDSICVDEDKKNEDTWTVDGTELTNTTAWNTTTANHSFCEKKPVLGDSCDTNGECIGDFTCCAA